MGRGSAGQMAQVLIIINQVRVAPRFRFLIDIGSLPLMPYCVASSKLRADSSIMFFSAMKSPPCDTNLAPIS